MSCTALVDAPAGISQAGCWLPALTVQGFPSNIPQTSSNLNKDQEFLKNVLPRSYRLDVRNEERHFSPDTEQTPTRDGHEVITELGLDGPRHRDSVENNSTFPGELGNAKGSTTDGTQRGQPVLHAGSSSGRWTRTATSKNPNLPPCPAAVPQWSKSSKSRRCRLLEVH